MARQVNPIVVIKPSDEVPMTPTNQRAVGDGERCPLCDYDGKWGYCMTQEDRADALATLRTPGWRPISEAPEVGQMVAVHAPGAMLADVWPARWNGHNFDAGGGWFEQDEVAGWYPLPPLPPAPGER